MQVIVTPKARGQYNNLPETEQTKIKKKILTLETSPLIGKKLSGELSELRSLRAWPYRIIYYFSQEDETVFVTSIIHRQGASK